jgi:hypothetical protein
MTLSGPIKSTFTVIPAKAGIQYSIDFVNINEYQSDTHENRTGHRA